ncbi:MAG: beta-N-acetylglucosaminidase domain-containing protein [Kiritimatiellae bacterium]|nr:beta-N-acetylglucosaminidase domain-containing protein [Kiritimatiellia bacterium]
MKTKHRYGAFPLCLLWLVVGGAMSVAFAGDFSGYEIPFYTGVISPAPREVTYADEFMPLDRAGILLGAGIKADDPRVHMLLDRIASNGGQAEVVDKVPEKLSGRTVISLGDTALARRLLLKTKLPEQAEGYIILPAEDNGVPALVVQGRDNLGFTWGVVSLNQLIARRDGKAAARKAQVSDWPEFPGKRGWLASPWSGTGSDWAFVAAAFKCNTLIFHSGKLLDGKSPLNEAEIWRAELPEAWKAEMRKVAAFLNPLGIQWYIGIGGPIRGPSEGKIRSKDEKDFTAIFKTASVIAAAGGNVMLLWDDTRFPISSADMKDFGSAREADIYLLNKLYAALKEKYPGVHLWFCPPFYWGPAASAAYPEGRDEYLSALGARLPKEVGICWTGPSVGSSGITRENVQWISALIRRKPWVFQNGLGALHAYGYHYVTDPVAAWRDWYYDGFFNDIELYALNTNVPHPTAALLTLWDYLWNPGAYDAAQAIEEAAKKLTGAETWPALVELNRQLGWFDQYGLRVSPGASKNSKEIKEKVAELEQAWDKALAHHPAAVEKWTSLGNHVKQQKSFLNGLLKNPDLAVYGQQEQDVREMAKKESAFDPAKDIFLSPYSFSGRPADLYAYKCEKRLASWIYGARSKADKLHATFDLPEHPASDYTLIVSGQDDDGPNKCKIRILVNGNVVFEGENPFVQFGWSQHKFVIKAAFMKNADNSLSIENIEDSDNNIGPPFYMLNYALIRKSG